MRLNEKLMFFVVIFIHSFIYISIYLMGDFYWHFSFILIFLRHCVIDFTGKNLHFNIPYCCFYYILNRGRYKGGVN